MRSFEEILRPLAGAQHGVITRRQLSDAGIPRGVLARHVTSGRLTRLHRGVYLAGPGRPEWCAEMAAVLACGEDAFLARTSAVRLWDLDAGEGRGSAVEVLGRGQIRERPGIRVRRTSLLPASDTTCRLGIPVTTPMRTILDLADDAPARVVDRVLGAAIARRLVTPAGIRRRLGGRARRPGTGRLRAWLALAGQAMPRSALERAFLRLMIDAGVTEPECNAVVGGVEVDFLWRRQRLAVETDGLRFHNTREVAVRDRAKAATLAVHGYRLMRLTWEHVISTPLVAVALVAGALAAGGWDGAGDGGVGG